MSVINIIWASGNLDDSVDIGIEVDGEIGEVTLYRKGDGTFSTDWAQEPSQWCDLELPPDKLAEVAEAAEMAAEKYWDAFARF